MRAESHSFFRCIPIQESCRRPAAALDRNLAYIGIVEVLHGYPFDGVVLMTGCDKTTPACLMAAATMNLPAIVQSGGPMLDGWYNGELAGSWDDGGGEQVAGRGEDRHGGISRAGGRLDTERGTLQHDGNRPVDELTGGGAGNVAAGLRLDPGGLS